MDGDLSQLTQALLAEHQTEQPRRVRR